MGELDGVAPFGVANADDLYGSSALAILAEHLSGPAAGDALVAFRLDRAVIGDSPVTRGVCRTGADGRLVQIDERRGVTRRADGTFSTGDDRSPAVLDPATLVSMNLWGFTWSMAAEFSAAMAEADRRRGAAARTGRPASSPGPSALGASPSSRPTAGASG